MGHIHIQIYRHLIPGIFSGSQMGPDSADMYSGEEEEKQSGGERNRFRVGRKEEMAVEGSCLSPRWWVRGCTLPSHRFTFHPVRPGAIVRPHIRQRARIDDSSRRNATSARSRRSSRWRLCYLRGLCLLVNGERTTRVSPEDICSRETLAAVIACAILMGGWSTLCRCAPVHFTLMKCRK